jgi:hypothetical protein
MVLKTYMERISDRIPHLDMITLIKCSAIMYITIIDIFIGIFIASLVTKYLLPKNFSKNDHNKSTIRLMSEISLIASILYILAYFIRNIVQLIPFPFDNKFNFDYSRMNEVKSGSLISATILMYCKPLYYKISIVRDRIMGTENKSSSEFKISYNQID